MDDKAQLEKFKDLARQLEADEDEKAFEDQVRKVAAAIPVRPAPKADGDA